MVSESREEIILTCLDLTDLVEEKELEIKVLNQMIVSANKMVQVKSLEFKRLKRKFDHKTRQMMAIAETLDPRQSHIVNFYSQI